MKAKSKAAAEIKALARRHWPRLDLRERVAGAFSLAN